MREGEGSLFVSLMGTPMYMAPEVLLHAEAGYSFKSDTWSLGHLLFEICNRRRMFSDSISLVSLMRNYMVTYRKQFDPSLYNAEMVKLVTSMLVYNAADRPSIAELLAHPLVIGHLQHLQRLKMKVLRALLARSDQYGTMAMTEAAVLDMVMRPVTHSWGSGRRQPSKSAAAIVIRDEVHGSSSTAKTSTESSGAYSTGACSTQPMCTSSDSHEHRAVELASVAPAITVDSL